jgi:hypothetical protein
MATVYLLDVTYLAESSPFSHEQRQRTLTGCPPLSWWCAGELSQWCSTVALRDAWAAAAKAGPPPQACPRSLTDGTACGDDIRSSYIALDGSGDGAGGGTYSKVATTAVVSEANSAAATAAPSLYRTYPFPCTVPIHTKYFTTTLSLLVGYTTAALGEGHVANAATAHITTALSRVLSSDLRERELRCSYGGVLTADVRQDPAEVPWHVLARGHGCLFCVVMVFLNEEEEEENEPVESVVTLLRYASKSDPTSAAGSTRKISSAQKERWQYFAVENGYECVFHAPITSSASPACVSREKLEAVSTASGRRGLLEAPLHGSNRLYQILCNTLWPAVVRNEGEAAEKRSAGVEEQVSPPAANVLIVVGNDVHTMSTLFATAATMKHVVQTRRQLRFFSQYVGDDVIDSTAPSSCRSACCGWTPQSSVKSRSGRRHDAVARATGCIRSCREGTPHPRLVLVNKYYAAVVQPQLLQTAFFSTAMEDMLARYWEQHFAPAGSLQMLCADAPVLVLWPPSPSSSSSFSCVVQQTDFCEAKDAEEGRRCGQGPNVRSAYPPLETILDTLKRHGCSEIVVVTPAYPTSTKAARCSRAAGKLHTPFLAQLSLTPYELQVCAERGVEVVNLNVSDYDASQADDAPPIPVLRDEDDVCATRGVDRLEEILHCVQWQRSHPLPSAHSDVCLAHGNTQESATQNSCLLLTHGQNAFQEEAWMGDVLSALRSMHPHVEPQSPWLSDVADLIVAAPSIAAITALAPPGRTANHNSLPAYLVSLENSYFTADVRVDLCGGLWTHYCHHPSASFTATTSPAVGESCPLPATWVDSYDAYLIVTSLRMLETAAAVATAAANGTSTDVGPAAKLIRSLSALTQKFTEWISGQQINANVACTAESADTPLALLYVADVAATDLERTTLATGYLSAINAMNPTGIAEVDEVEGNTIIPIEVVFASMATSPQHAAAEATTGWDTPSVEGLQRIQEAFEQQLWPHRLPRPYRQPASPPVISTAGTQSTTVQAAAAAEPSERTKKNVSEEAGMRADAKVTQGQVGVANSPDTVWSPPAVGCALPPHYLIDPETLRSVPLHSVLGGRCGSLASPRKPSRTTSRKRGLSLGIQTTHNSVTGVPDTVTPLTDTACKAASDAAPEAPLSATCDEALLTIWAEKMKTHGHRLGDAQRKEQAAMLALELERLL